jgi:predicted nucleic acid-binding protein
VILVDSSIWIDHIRTPQAGLITLLADGRVAQHPFVTAEVALGSFASRSSMIAALNRLVQAPVLEPSAFLAFIEEANLPATGLGMVDAHLLASANQMETSIWTRDRRLAGQAERLGLAYAPQ